MKIDSKRFAQDCATAQAASADSCHAHRNTGATAFALAAQGVVQGADRRPITARRLTALISAINKRERRREARLSSRAKRRDLAPFPASSHALALSADLNRANGATAVPAADSETSIRHQEFEDRIRSLLKQDPP